MTFLFTDIEGSTQLWESAPGEMDAALRLHDQILRQVIEANRGYVFKTVGDAFCAAFPSAEGAIAAAVQAQREIEGRPWSLPRPLRVRMGLHTGRAEERNNDYFGPTLNRTARLEAIGSGGQILVSRVCADLARDALPPDIDLVPLGEHRLKDLGRPEQVYQIAHPSLCADFGPLKSLDSHPNNLPVLPTALVGRGKELEQIAKLVLAEEVRLLTLTGPGGIGKTRLALQIGADVLDHFKHGVYFVDLSAVTAPSRLMPSIAQTLGVREGGSAAPEEALREHLAPKEILLVLDNFEQLVSAAPALAGLLARCPRVRALATSREILHLRGEHVYDVPPLELPPGGGADAEGRPAADPWSLGRYEAVNLFTDCVRRHTPEFALTMENAPLVAAICRRLEGLPLAIELAAARLRLFSPQTLLDRLEERLRILTGGHRDLPDRQRTLRAAIDWSHGLLGDAERMLFACLSVFTGGFTVEAAEKVFAETGGDALELVDLLSSLADKSLLRRRSREGEEPRFSFLETIRQYAHERLTAIPLAGRAREAHASYFLELAHKAERGLYGSSRPIWMRRVDLEIDNLRSAQECLTAEGDIERGLDLATCVTRYFRTKGMYTEGRRRLEAALPADCPASVLVRARALRGAGTLAQFQGDYRSAEGILRDAVRLFESTSDTEGTAFAYRDLGWTLYRLRSPEEALHAFWMSRALAEQLRDDYLVALCLLGIGSICRERGQTTEALEHFTRSLELLRARGDRENEANALGNIGTAHFQNGALEEARRYYLEAMRIEIELGDVAGLTIAYNNLGDIHMRLGEHDRASEFYDKLAQIAEETGSSSFLSVAYGGMAECALAMQSYTEALTYAKLSSRAAEEQGNTLFQAASLRVLGETHLACEDYEHARECLGQAVRLLEGMPGAEEELEKARKAYQLTEGQAERPPPEGTP